MKMAIGWKGHFRTYTVVGVTILVLASAGSSIAQNLGNNAVCTSATGCSTSGSAAFIDASAVAASNGSTDLCATIYFIFTNHGINYPSSGAVIDARGMPGASCQAGTPWSQSGASVFPPSTILLPAGTIVIPTGWVVPSQTRLIGEGDTIVSGGGTQPTVTTIQAAFSSGPIIQFGGASGSCPAPNPCTAIAVENLVLDGANQGVSGIVNQSAQDLSYVDHVSLYRIFGTGLSVSTTGANYSGPYSNIAFDTGSTSIGAANPVCASINGTTMTRGIHGLSCMVENGLASAAILLDASNNTIRDVFVDGFHDGVLLGENGSALSNVLTNIVGDTTRASGIIPVNTVHISSQHTVQELSLMGISNSGVGGTYSLEDDVTGAHLSDITVALYALGKGYSLGSSSTGYARFTTSPNIPTWATGSSAPVSPPACIQGSLYSCNGGSGCGGHVLWGCPAPGGTWTDIR